MNATQKKLRLGNYEPLVELASGGMATVYVARQLGAAGFERLVVIKRVHRHHLGNREFHRMFLDEARVASMVRHPNVVPVVDVVESKSSAPNAEIDGELFLVMEYIESAALSTVLKTVVQASERVPPAIGARIIADTLAGLHAAHEAVDMRGAKLDIVHRDVSPQNIIVGVDGTSRLIDFGVAKAAHRLTETKSGSLKGKLAYMSPEQAMGLEIDRRVDVFAAGVALHETLTGKRLFQGENDLDTMRRIMEAPVPDPSSIVQEIPPAVDAVVQKALMRDPAMRYQTASEFLEALEAAMPLASAREVGAFVQAKCADRLEERRTRLRQILEGHADPLSMPMLPEVHDPSSDPAAAETRGPAARASRPPRSSSGAASIPAQSISIALETQSQISYAAPSTRDASVPPPKSSGKLLLVGAALLAAAAIGGVVIWGALHRFGRDPNVIAATEPVESPPVALRTDGGQRKQDEVEVTLRADRPILHVRAPGMKLVRYEGAQAIVTVAPWTGMLAVDADLEGGRVAHANVDANGAHDVHLDVLPAPSPVATPADKTITKPLGTKPAAGRRPKSELQENPY